MKKTLLSMVGVAVTALAFGQVSNNAPAPQKVMQSNGTTELSVAPVATYSTRSASRGTAALGTIHFSETFGAGLAGDGSNGAWTTNGTVSGSADPDAVWEYRGPSTTPGVGTGSRGQWAGTAGVAGGAPLTSATSANGFFIFDSDYLDTKGTGAGNGDAVTPHKSWLISPAFSTVGSSNITINFSTYFRRFQGECFVLLSIDGGTTWGDSVVIMDVNWAVNAASDIDAVINERVPYIENQSNVKIAFFFDGETASNANGSGYYFAMVDDVVLSDLADNDLSIGAASYRTLQDTGAPRYYSRVPNFLASYDTIQFSATVTNNGGAIQPNTHVTNNMTTPTGSSMLTSNMVNLASGASDSLIIATTTVLDQGVGTYSWAFSVSSDSTEDIDFDNALDTVTVDVTDTTYSRDFGATGNFWYGSGSTYEIGVAFDVYESAKATSISVAVGAASTPGEVISVYIYDASTDLSTPVTSREFIVLDSNTVGDLVSYSIPQVVLTPGTYYVTYKTYSDAVYFRVSDFDATGGMAVTNPSTGTGWSFTTSVPAVRLNVTDYLFVCDLEVTASQTANNTGVAVAAKGTMPYAYLWSNGATGADLTNAAPGTYTVTVTDDSACTATASVDIITGIIENEINGSISLYPNPNNGTFQLSLEGVDAGVYNVSVTNMIGQTIYSNPINVGGNYNGNIALSNLENGVYFMEISSENGERSVVKFVVK